MEQQTKHTGFYQIKQLSIFFTETESCFSITWVLNMLQYLYTAGFRHYS